MRYLGEVDATRMMGVGYLGEVRQGPDGALYQYVQGVDGFGNPIGGFWSRLKKLTARALPIAQRASRKFGTLTASRTTKWCFAHIGRLRIFNRSFRLPNRIPAFVVVWPCPATLLSLWQSG